MLSGLLQSKPLWDSWFQSTNVSAGPRRRRLCAPHCCRCCVRRRWIAGPRRGAACHRRAWRRRWAERRPRRQSGGRESRAGHVGEGVLSGRTGMRLLAFPRLLCALPRGALHMCAARERCPGQGRGTRGGQEQGVAPRVSCCLGCVVVPLRVCLRCASVSLHANWACRCLPLVSI